MDRQVIKNNTIVKHYAGSIAYGTNTPESDIDIRGIFCAEKKAILTPFFPIKETSEEGEDTKLFELHHYCKLAADNNPNIIESLWVDEGDIIEHTKEYVLLRLHRDLFLSKKIAFTTSGYAMAQLKRIKGHNKWINNPQEIKPPEQKDFISLVQNFLPEKIFTFNDFLKTDKYIYKQNIGMVFVHFGGNIYGLYEWDGGWLFDTGGVIHSTEITTEDKTPWLIVKFNREEYKLAKEKHRQYWEWKANRNKARSELEEAWGYDTKHAMHLVRLMRMGKEALETGQVCIKRPDAKELLGIRNGSMTYEEIVKYAEEMDDLIRNKLYRTSELRHTADIHRISEVLMEIQDSIWTRSIV